MLQFDPTRYAYPSRRSVVYGRAMACTSVPLGAQVGLAVLRDGGNAMDAAVAMAAAMPILEPTSNGIGSDSFALIWSEKEKRLYGLNASGKAPLALSLGVFREKGLAQVPSDGWLPTMVPGAPAGWAAIHRRFGTKPLTELLAPAIDYARNGMPLPETVGHFWALGVERFRRAMAAGNPAPFSYWWKSMTKPDGSPYAAGELFRWEEMARTLEELAETGCESLYRGDLMKKTVAFSRKTGGYFSEEDFATYQPEWVEPITTDYRGYTVCEIPPNGHGITVLMALNILRGFELPAERQSVETYHLIMEALKLAFVDAKTYVSDPRTMKTSVADLLSEEYAARRRALIGKRALLPEAGDPACGGTIYLCTADAAGNMVSYIQSNYMGFGSGVAIPGTGIALQNRGANFSLDPRSDNCVAGGKKSYHTIIPGFLCKDGAPIGPFGVMGGFMQPQGHVQVLVNAIDYGMNPQECLDCPRAQWTGGRHIQLEREVPAHVAQGLADRGHEIEILNDNRTMGRGEIIWRTENGVLAGATEPRCDGQVAAM